MNLLSHRRAIGLGAIGLVFLALFHLATHDPGEVSFHGAHRIHTDVDWSRPELQHIIWLATNQVLFYRPPGFFRLNLDTKEETSFLPGLRLPPDASPRSLFWKGTTAPDGKNLLLGFATSASNQQTYLVHLPDLQTVTMTNLSVFRCFWLPDSSGWIHTAGRRFSSLVIDRFDLSGKPIQTATHSTRGRGAAIGIARDGRLITTGFGSNGVPFGVEINQFKLNELQAPPARAHVPLPLQVVSADLSLSPGGDWFLAGAYSQRLLPEVELLGEFPYLSVQKQGEASLWVVPTDPNSTTHAIELGDITLIARLDTMDPLRIDWYPDGHSIYFIHGSNLWLRSFAPPGGPAKR